MGLLELDRRLVRGRPAKRVNLVLLFQELMVFLRFLNLACVEGDSSLVERLRKIFAHQLS